LLGTGHELNDVIIQRLRTLAERQIIRATILVAMPDAEPGEARGSATTWLTLTDMD
jgi:hypothetical protein